MGTLEGKSAIVTGASRGIGAATAESLAAAGANVALNFRGSLEEAEKVALRCRRHGVAVRLARGDVADRDEVERVVAETVEDFGGLDIAVSNAAYSTRQLFHTADMVEFEKTIQVTMWGAYYLLRAAANAMIASETRGAIVIVSSPHSWRPLPGAMSYNMAKAAIDQMARTAATELCNKRIRVNLVHPGWIDTPGERKFFSEEKLEKMGAELPWGRMGRADEVARGITFLCDPGSDYITGTSLLIDGGIELPVNEMHRLERPAEMSEPARQHAEGVQ